MSQFVHNANNLLISCFSQQLYQDTLRFISQPSSTCFFCHQPVMSHLLETQAHSSAFMSAHFHVCTLVSQLKGPGNTCPSQAPRGCFEDCRVKFSHLFVCSAVLPLKAERRILELLCFQRSCASDGCSWSEKQMVHSDKTPQKASVWCLNENQWRRNRILELHFLMSSCFFLEMTKCKKRMAGKRPPPPNK